MDIVKTIDFTPWFPYDGIAEGSGRSEKIWLQSKEGQIGLFKFPKINEITKEITTEYVSEHLACQLGKLLKVKTAEIDIGIRDGRIGCMSYLINEPGFSIVEGAIYIAGKHPDYDLEKMVELSTGRYYCLDHLIESCTDWIDWSYWLKMMVFDFLIGNSDRHQHNWANLVGYDESQSLWIRNCPLYDNGSSLCSFVNEAQVIAYLGNDQTRFNSLVDSKSKSMIRIDGYSRKRPTHKEVVRHLLSEYSETKGIVSDFLDKGLAIDLNDLLGVYCDILSENKIDLIIRFLHRKFEILEELRSEV